VLTGTVGTNIMTNQKAKEYTDTVFNQIMKCKSIEELLEIYTTCDIPDKNRMDSVSYPKLEIRITEAEIKDLKKSNYINDNLEFEPNLSSLIKDPLCKLLYATAWKNGDLKKIKHIVKGIIEVNQEETDQNSALVFYQFGKYLTNTPGQPIIDQHVIRAFGVYRSFEESDITKYGKLKALNKGHKKIIDEYKKWLLSDNINPSLKAKEDYSYHIDQLLFALGKTLKNNILVPTTVITNSSELN
jgi:hypothetical protein